MGCFKYKFKAYSLRNKKKVSVPRHAINNSLTSICAGAMIYALAHAIHLNKFYWLILAISIANVTRKNTSS